MHGFQITFFFQQDRVHCGKPLAQWLIDRARAIGIGGATLVAASEGYGRHQHIHSDRFVELVDQPMQIVVVVTADEAERLFAKLNADAVKVFYLRMPIEFGLTPRMDRIVDADTPGDKARPGYQLSFFTVQDRVHCGKPLAQWLLDEARAMGIRGATLIPASEGFGHDGRVHAMHLFKMNEHPLQIIMIVGDEEAVRLFEKLDQERVRIFYSMIRVEFGTTSGGA